MSKDTRGGGSRQFTKNPKLSCFSYLVALSKSTTRTEPSFYESCWRGWPERRGAVSGGGPPALHFGLGLVFKQNFTLFLSIAKRLSSRRISLMAARLTKPGSYQWKQGCLSPLRPARCCSTWLRSTVGLSWGKEPCDHLWGTWCQGWWTLWPIWATPRLLPQASSTMTRRSLFWTSPSMEVLARLWLDLEYVALPS